MLIPLSDDNTGRQTTPYVTYTFLAINIVVFIVQFLQGDAFTLGYAAVPYEITHNVDLVNPRGNIPQMPGPTPIWLTLITSMFMHGGWAHIGGNMLFLFVFGDNVERALGHIKYLLFYLVCGVIAAYAQILSGPESVIPSLGASGAISGALAAYLGYFPQNKVRVLVGWRSARQV